MSGGFLTHVCAQAVARVAAARQRESLDELRTRALATPAPPAFGDVLRDGRIIAEVKRASPSRGVIAAGCDAVAQARAYVAGGAAAVSVLTEPEHFHGDLRDLEGVAAAVSWTEGSGARFAGRNVAVPVLRKDFVVDPYQLYEARAAGAAAALLLVAALEQDRLIALLAAARAAGIEALIETHDVVEAGRAAAALSALPHSDRVPVVGVNVRDMQRLSVDHGVFATVVGALPRHAVVVAESGVNGPADVARYIGDGADAVLVGEYLMRAADPAAATRELAEAARTPTNA